MRGLTVTGQAKLGHSAILSGSMFQSSRRIEFLRTRIGFLEAKKAQLQTLVTSSEVTAETREIWATQLDSTIEKLHKHSAELHDLVREN